MDISKVFTGLLPLYIEGDIRPEMRGGFINDKAYTAYVDNTIVVCADAVIINRGKRVIYLAKRAIRPMKGLWWIGGRRNKGEAPKESMRRNFKRETRLDLPEERFTFVTMTEYLWQDREQKPWENGSHNLCHQFTVELTDEELHFVRYDGLSEKEYDGGFGLKGFNLKSLIAKDDVHPVILDVYRAIFP